MWLQKKNSGKWLQIKSQYNHCLLCYWWNCSYITNTPSQFQSVQIFLAIPANCLSFSNWFIWSPFVSISASYHILRSTIAMSLLSSQLLPNHRQMSISLVLPCSCWFLAKHMVDWLSSKMSISVIFLFIKSFMSCRSQIVSCAAVDKVTYSASAVDRAIQVCLLLFQLIAAFPKRNT